MAEPTSSAIVAATTAGLTLFGLATGLDQTVLLAGFAGGLWALSYQDPVPAAQRITFSITAAVVAGYLAPAAAMGAMVFGGPVKTLDIVFIRGAAVLIGFLAHKVLGPIILRKSSEKIEEVLTK